jgi:hypothetical protein
LIESRSRMWKSLRNLVGHALLTTQSRDEFDKPPTSQHHAMS